MNDKKQNTEQLFAQFETRTFANETPVGQEDVNQVHRLIARQLDEKERRQVIYKILNDKSWARAWLSLTADVTPDEHPGD